MRGPPENAALERYFNARNQRVAHAKARARTRLTIARPHRRALGKAVRFSKTANLVLNYFIARSDERGFVWKSVKAIAGKAIPATHPTPRQIVSRSPQKKATSDTVAYTLIREPMMVGASQPPMVGRT